MQFRSYPKIHRLGKEETDDILDQPVQVQEKVDGANISIWLGENGVECGSRRRKLGEESFNGFVETVKGNNLIESYLKGKPNHRLFGEWLVKHTVNYNNLAYHKIYLFDIYDEESEKYLSQSEVENVAKTLELEYPTLFIKEPRIVTKDELDKIAGRSELGEKGEGIVIKPDNFVNKFGDIVYAKVVTQDFKEKNGIIFGGNNKHSETYNEMYIVNKYCTLARVKKNMDKMQPTVDRRLHMEHTPMIASVCYHDLITEDMWEIIKKIHVVNFQQLKRLATKKFIQIYHDILNDSVSVADRSNK